MASKVTKRDIMGDLTSKQKAAIAALLEGQTQGGAARAAGVARQTLGKWLNNPDFAQALREGSDGAIRAASARLAALTEAAVDSIEASMTQPTTPGASLRLRAADALLSHALRIREHADILERLSELERRLNENT